MRRWSATALAAILGTLGRADLPGAPSSGSCAASAGCAEALAGADAPEELDSAPFVSMLQRAGARPLAGRSEAPGVNLTKEEIGADTALLEQSSHQQLPCRWVPEETVPPSRTSLDCWRPAKSCVARFTLLGQTHYGCTYAVGSSSTPRCSKEADARFIGGRWADCEPIPCAPATSPQVTAAAESTGIAFPLKTDGRFIVDDDGYRVKWSCVNWYGAHMKQLTANGLDTRSAEAIAQTIHDSGFNCVRLPYAVKGYMENPAVRPEYLTKSSRGSTGRTSLDVLDEVVEALTSKGLMVILNNHMSDVGWCCGLTDNNGLWFNRHFSQENWLVSLWGLSRRYRNNPLVVGHDTRNEVRPSSSGAPLWGLGSDKTTGFPPQLIYSLRTSTEQAAAAVLQASSGQQLVVAEPLFGVFLCEADKILQPLEVPCLEGRLVYSMHDYSFSDKILRADAKLCRFDPIGALTTAIASQAPPYKDYKQFKKVRYSIYGHVAFPKLFHKFPIWIGEFGQDTADQWWDFLTAYLDEYDIDWSYWALDGYAYPAAAQALGDAAAEHGQDETYGILNQDYATVRHTWKLDTLKALQASRDGKLRPGQTPRPPNSSGKIPP